MKIEGLAASCPTDPFNKEHGFVWFSRKGQGMDQLCYEFCHQHVIQDFIRTSRELFDNISKNEPIPELAFPARLHFDETCLSSKFVQVC